MALLRVANLKKSYNITKTQKQEVLKDINIEFKSGDLIALLGESGCGKSTLINILGGLDTDYTGSVVIKDEFIRDYSEKQMDDYRKKRVGLIFQNYNLIPHMTIKENIKIAMTISDINEKNAEERAEDLLKLIGLNNYANKLPNQLSGGQKQRVAIARALANNPTIILADEPTGALDADSAEIVMQILKKIAESGKLVIIVTHSEKVASECGRIVKMENGVIASDTVNKKFHIDTKRDKEIVPKNIKTKNILKMSTRNVKQKKSRSVLVSVAMAIGMAAVLLILCLSSGLSNYVNKVYADSATSLELIATKNGKDSSFTESELSDISSLSGISSSIKTMSLSDAKYVYDGGEEKDISNIKTYFTGSFSPILLYGELKADTTDTNYILINETMAKTIDEESIIACVGKEISLTKDNTKTFVISGIFDDIYGSPNRNNAFISETSLKSIISEDAFVVNTIYITASNASYIQALKEDLTSLGASVFHEESSVDSVMEYIDLGTNILTAVGGVSLVVSAIMIFIVLYISVNERMKEIGIMRAIGARKKDIRKLFMFEAGIMGLVAGICAVGACFAISLITNIICLSTLEYSLISYNVIYYLAGIILNVLISVLAGIAPAIKASDLDPVEALRAE